MGTAEAPQDWLTISGQRFKPYLSETIICDRLDAMAEQILSDYEGRRLQLLQIAMGGVVGATLLASRIRRQDPHMRRLQISYNLVRLRIAGSGSGAQVVRRFSDYTSVAGQDVMLFDGVVRSGNTIQMLEARMTNEQTEPLPASIAVAALVDKPAARSKVGRHVKVHYAGFAVPQDTYLVGVGLDHEGIGRELPHIYRDIDPNLAEEPRYELPEFNGGQAWRRP